MIQNQREHSGILVSTKVWTNVQKEEFNTEKYNYNVMPLIETVMERIERVVTERVEIRYGSETTNESLLEVFEVWKIWIKVMIH